MIIQNRYFENSLILSHRISRQRGENKVYSFFLAVLFYRLNEKCYHHTFVIETCLDQFYIDMKFVSLFFRTIYYSFLFATHRKKTPKNMIHFATLRCRSFSSYRNYIHSNIMRPMFLKFNCCE